MVIGDEISLWCLLASSLRIIRNKKGRTLGSSFFKDNNLEKAVETYTYAVKLGMLFKMTE